MKISELSAFWIKNEIQNQKNLIKNLELSQMKKMKGFNEVLEMREKFLSVAEKQLEKINQLK